MKYCYDIWISVYIFLNNLIDRNLKITLYTWSRVSIKPFDDIICQQQIYHINLKPELAENNSSGSHDTGISEVSRSRKPNIEPRTRKWWRYRGKPGVYQFLTDCSAPVSAKPCPYRDNNSTSTACYVNKQLCLETITLQSIFTCLTGCTSCLCILKSDTNKKV